MASKFQNRLVGTVILVALVVIVLPAVLDGHKKHYQDDFAAIPLVPGDGDKPVSPPLPSVTQPLSLPAQPPEGAGEEVKAAAASVPSAQTLRQAATGGLSAPLAESLAEPSSAAPRVSGSTRQSVTSATSSSSTSTSSTAATANQPATLPSITTGKKPAEKTPAQPGAEQDEILALLQRHTQNASTKKTTSQPPASQTDNPPPVGTAYVVQLGALRNADKVNEIVDKLRAAGYRVYTVPATAQPDNITRILVGPDTSKEKLTAALADLQRLSGLSGVVKNYSVNQ